MTARAAPRIAAALLAAGAVAVVLVLVLGSSGARAPTVTVTRATVGWPIPPGFVGLSIELTALERYAGADPGALDPVFVRLLTQLAPSQRGVLRLGGDSTDWGWWPVPGMRRPAGIRYSLNATWMRVARALAAAVDARLILGVNLEADSARLAGAEARAMARGIGSSSIRALELGNEPELYGSFGWYRSSAGRQVPGRPRDYDLTAYIHDFTRIAPRLPEVPLAGPAVGAAQWLTRLGAFLRAAPHVRLATVHAYPLKHCRPASIVTIGELLSEQASHGLAQQLIPYARVAAAHGVPLRVDEMNGISCGGTRGVSDSFASALWVLDTLFELARAGVGGVNIHSMPGRINEILGPERAGGTWRMRVHPEYYGMIMFAQAAPAGSRLLQVASRPTPGVKVWATRARGGAIHVVVINKRLRRPVALALRIAGARGVASLTRLRAPRVGATGGVTLGGQSFGAATATGLLAGTASDQRVAQSDGAYPIRVPPASAVMLTLGGN